MEEIVSFDNQATERDPRFWTVYLLNAYQAEGGSDWDPRTEVAPNDKPTVGRTQDSRVSFVFVEPSGPKECSNNQPMFVCNMSTITAREVARALGAEELDEGLLDLLNAELSDTSLRKIRSQPVP